MVRMLTVLAALLLGAVGCARPADPEAASPPPQTTAWAAIDGAGGLVTVGLDGALAWRPAGSR
jgi:hypothetical protein